jgi:hypothetical protein
VHIKHFSRTLIILPPPAWRAKNHWTHRKFRHMVTVLWLLTFIFNMVYWWHGWCFIFSHYCFFLNSLALFFLIEMNTHLKLYFIMNILIFNWCFIYLLCGIFFLSLIWISLKFSPVQFFSQVVQSNLKMLPNLNFFYFLILFFDFYSCELKYFLFYLWL